MRYLFAFALHLIFLTSFTAQTWGEQITDLENNFKESSVLGLNLKVDQVEMIEKYWKEGTYTYYWVKSGKLQKTGQSTISFEHSKESDRINVIKIGSDKYYASDYHAQIKKNYTYDFGGDLDIVFTKEMIIQYERYSGFDGTRKVRIKGIIKNKTSKLKELEAALVSYLGEARSKSYYMKEMLEEEKKLAQRKAAEKELRKYSIYDKKVKSISLHTKYGEMGAWYAGEDNIYGIVATLEDGGEIKTNNIGGKGFLSDYIIKESKVNFPKGKDIYTIEVTSRYDKTISIKRDLVIEYPNFKELKLNGADGAFARSKQSKGGDGANGRDVVIKVKRIPHSELKNTYIDYYQITIGNFEPKLFKMQKGGKLQIYTNGGDGGEGGKGTDKQAGESGQPGISGAGGNGGNGGNITVYLDPSMEGEVNISYENKGGKWGWAGKRGNCWNCRYGSHGELGQNGSNGKKGTYKVIKQPVSF